MLEQHAVVFLRMLIFHDDDDLYRCCLTFASQSVRCPFFYKKRLYLVCGKSTKKIKPFFLTQLRPRFVQVSFSSYINNERPWKRIILVLLQLLTCFQTEWCV